ncbi:MAG: AI-2E family transporter [Gammaproteobacteria bacterium]|nr:AI-2E family transporter [Gammaproteobacteria bacterium]
MKFLEVISTWINRYFSNEEAIYLVVMLIVVLIVLVTLGVYLAPVLTGVVVAFLLEGTVERLIAWRVPPLVAVWMVFLGFIGVLVAVLTGILPLIWRQLFEAVNAMPALIDRLREVTDGLAVTYPNLVSEGLIDSWLQTIGADLAQLGGRFLQTMVAQVPNVFGLLIYLILVPISVFFFLKDREKLMARFLLLLPAHRPLLNQVGEEMNVQIANYVRGKSVEIIIVGTVSYITFASLGLNYAALLGLVVGLSVLIPFIGAAVVTVPVAAVAFLQWGWSLEFLYLLIGYGIIQALDGNVLVPLLFSEANDLHPIMIIVAVLAFGGLWGLWGVFFAIPLATLVKAIFNAWPRQAGTPAAL